MQAKGRTCKLHLNRLKPGASCCEVIANYCPSVFPKLKENFFSTCKRYTPKTLTWRYGIKTRPHKPERQETDLLLIHYYTGRILISSQVKRQFYSAMECAWNFVIVMLICVAFQHLTPTSNRWPWLNCEKAVTTFLTSFDFVHQLLRGSF